MICGASATADVGREKQRKEKQMKTITNTIYSTLALAYLGLFPNAQAVVPAPDGGYPGFNTAEGQNALFSLTTGQGNTAVGWRSLFSNAAGSFNTATGAGALLVNTADQNTATGAGALLSNTTGLENTANGAFALLNNTGNGNTANGVRALLSNTAGGTNTAIGVNALTNNVTGSGNIALGFGAGLSVTTADNVICIGDGGANVSNSCYIGNIFGQTASGGSAVFIDATNKLGTITSSKRFKDEIKPMDETSEALFALKPVNFRYKKEIDPGGTSQFGLVAEDVEKVNPDLVVRDKEGKPYSVRYDQVNAMLLNEFLKEHHSFLEEQKKVQRLEAALEAVNKRLKKQETRIENVSAQIKISKAASQLVINQR
jgi:trimeric autotransporter adhesin